MKTTTLFLFLVIYCLLSGTNNSYPDFKKIVESRKTSAEQKAKSFSKWMDSLTEDNREMENYDVKYYLIDIVLDFEEEYITADNSIKLEFIENNVSSIQLHFTNNLNIDGIVSGSETISYTHSENIIDIDLGEEYSSGDQLELEIQYSGYPDVRLEDGIKFEEHNNIPVVFSMVSPKGARKWWPCKDTPADKPDSLDIWVTFPEIYTSASNGLLIEEIDNGDGTTTNKWHESYP
ncbi:MAG: hypothetical protein H8E57_03965, partial [Candidatus Cloacimonetes bacterium]|nr:hypothetical protein [Candidatus Cloacimonadota bacterium]